jgi:transmembrane sensor
MFDDTKTLERIGARVAEGLGEGVLSEDRRAIQRRAFLAAALTAMDSASASDRRNRVVVRIAAVAAVALIAIGAAALLPRGVKPLSFWVGDQRTAGSEGTWIESSGTREVPIVFDNGSRFDLRAETAVRVAAANTQRVAVDVSEGELFADIKHNEGTKWEVNAGPYRVTVLGTAFTVDWAASSGELVVAVSRGVVLVRGGNLSEYGLRVPAGKRLVVAGLDGRVAVEAIDASGAVLEPRAKALPDDGTAAGGEAPTVSDDLAPVRPAVVEERASSTASSAARPSGQKAKAPDVWKSFYAKRDYAAAVAAAETEGIESLIGRLGVDDLWCLANASRFAHRGDVARRVLLAVRARFSDTPRATTAAFLLGRSELEDRGNAEIARGWFETYLREARNGPLAEEALGRLVEACDKAGSEGDARRYAERYLSRYQDGLFAALAKSILAR